MVRKNTIILSMLIAALLVSVMNINIDNSPYMKSVSTTAASFGEFTGMSIGTFATGIVIEYTILLAAVYFFLRGIVKRFEN
ncbi:MAG: hypothetical protein KAS32_09580 [Candidatus Peribacteraceae bacterium]|nr:hypothetical protein [Candidatus Peribacteraceae bacterium]